VPARALTDEQGSRLVQIVRRGQHGPARVRRAMLTGDYSAAATSHRRALALCRDLGNLEGQAEALNCLGMEQQETGDYPAAAASQQQALALFGDLGNQEGQAGVLNCLGMVQQETGDYPAAASSHWQALALFREFGDRLGQAEALNGLGELASRTSATGEAREHHTQALDQQRQPRPGRGNVAHHLVPGAVSPERHIPLGRVRDRHGRLPSLRHLATGAATG
jgi:tetratricopeptide (TPR) repeat protein